MHVDIDILIRARFRRAETHVHAGEGQPGGQVGRGGMGEKVPEDGRSLSEPADSDRASQTIGQAYAGAPGLERKGDFALRVEFE